MQTTWEVQEVTGVQATQVSGVVGPPGFNQEPGWQEVQRELEAVVHVRAELHWAIGEQGIHVVPSADRKNPGLQVVSALERWLMLELTGDEQSTFPAASMASAIKRTQLEREWRWLLPLSEPPRIEPSGHRCIDAAPSHSALDVDVPIRKQGGYGPRPHASTLIAPRRLEVRRATRPKR